MSVIPPRSWLEVIKKPSSTASWRHLVIMMMAGWSFQKSSSNQIKHLSWSSFFPRLLKIWLSRTSIRRSPCKRRWVERGQRLWTKKHLSFIPHPVCIFFAPNLRHVSRFLDNDLQLRMLEYCWLQQWVKSKLWISPATPFLFQEPHPLLVALSPLPDIHVCQRKEEIDKIISFLFHLQRVKATWSSACKASLLDLQHDDLLSWTCPYCHLLVLLPENGHFQSTYEFAHSFKPSCQVWMKTDNTALVCLKLNWRSSVPPGKVINCATLFRKS